MSVFNAQSVKRQVSAETLITVTDSSISGSDHCAARKDECRVVRAVGERRRTVSASVTGWNIVAVVGRSDGQLERHVASLIDG